MEREHQAEVEACVERIVQAPQDSAQQKSAFAALMRLVLGPLERRIASDYPGLPDDERAGIAISVVARLSELNYRNLRHYIARRAALRERASNSSLPFQWWLARLCRWHVVMRMRKLHRIPGLTASSASDLTTAEDKSASITLGYERIARSQDERTRQAIANQALGYLSEPQRRALEMFHEDTAPSVPPGEKHRQIRTAYRRIQDCLGLSTEYDAQQMVKVAHLRARRWVIRLVAKSAHPRGRKT